MASQIKLLLEIPERIWSAMEASQYLQATQLYLLCCHLHSLLQLEAATGGLYSPVLARFPILVRQVATTGHFRYWMFSYQCLWGDTMSPSKNDSNGEIPGLKTERISDGSTRSRPN